MRRSRVYDRKDQRNSYSFITKSPSNTHNVMRILLPSKPSSIVVKMPKEIIWKIQMTGMNYLTRVCYNLLIHQSGRSVQIDW